MQPVEVPTNSSKLSATFSLPLSRSFCSSLASICAGAMPLMPPPSIDKTRIFIGNSSASKRPTRTGLCQPLFPSFWTKIHVVRGR